MTHEVTISFWMGDISNAETLPNMLLSPSRVYRLRDTSTGQFYISVGPTFGEVGRMLSFSEAQEAWLAAKRANLPLEVLSYRPAFVEEGPADFETSPQQQALVAWDTTFGSNGSKMSRTVQFIRAIMGRRDWQEWRYVIDRGQGVSGEDYRVPGIDALYSSSKSKRRFYVVRNATDVIFAKMSHTGPTNNFRIYDLLTAKQITDAESLV